MKVARNSFSESIPSQDSQDHSLLSESEHKLRRHKQTFGKIATTVVLRLKFCHHQGCNYIGVVIAMK